ncbi:cell envelope integrity protein TolA [Oxalobacteraceae sp. CFBP 8755]|nr:cell envelope integrity protein TolA [Oxalobacteraceae sp. CFBP 8755]MBD8722876.1 cell envelope integrity protein TolA [Oxalobacteraceae sp. CFBP 13708]
MHPATASTRRAGHARSNRRLVGGIAISLLLHALLLSLQFGVPGSDAGGGGPLSVVLAPAALPVPAPTVAALPTSIVPTPVQPPPALPVAAVPPAPAPARGLRLVDLPPPPPPPPVAQIAAAPKPRARRPAPIVPKRVLRDVATPVIAIEANPESEFAVAVPLPEVDAGSPPTVVEPVDSPEEVAVSDMPVTPEPVVDAEAERAEREQALQQELALQREQEQARLAQEQAESQRNAAEASRLAEQQQQQQQVQQQQALRDQEALVQREQQAAAARDLAAQRAAQEAATQEALAQAQLQARQRAEDAARRVVQEAAERQRTEELAQRKLAEEQARLQAAERQRAEDLAQRRLAEDRARQQAVEQARVDAERLARGAAEEAARQAAQRLQAQASGPAAGAGAGPAAGNSAAARTDGIGAGVGVGSGAGMQPGPGAMAGLPGNRARELLRGVTIPNVDASGLPRDRPAGNRRVVADGGERDAPLRLYVDSVRQKLERNAVLGGARLSLRDVRIDPLVSISLRSDGSIDEITIVRSSGRADMDDAVRRFVRLNARYAAFPPNVAANFDVIEIRRIWRFAEGLKLVEEMR